VSDSFDSSPLELDPVELRRLAHLVADQVADRWVELGDRPVSGKASRAEMEERLREPIPRSGVPLEESLELFWREIEPYAGKIDHPGFFAFIPSSPTFASLVGDWLAAGCNIFQGTWLESAGPSQVELVVLDWLKECLGFPMGGSGILTSGGSAANLMGLAVAREERLDGSFQTGTAYCSDQTHTAVDRALRILGFPRGALRRLPARADWTLDPLAVARAVAEDREKGLRPFCVIASAGTTNTGAVDPLDELADLCVSEGLWLHVDGAYGAFARLAERGSARLRGLERADSLVLDPHKWLYVGYEAGCLLVRDGDALPRCFHVLPDYLQDTQTTGGEVNFADYGLQLSRAARALKLWFSFRTHGLEAISEAVDRTMRLADLAERLVRETDRLELTSPSSLGILSFRFVGLGSEDDARLDDLNAAILARFYREGRFMASSTRLGGRFVIRLCPMNYRTTRDDVAAFLEEVVRIGNELLEP